MHAPAGHLYYLSSPLPPLSPAALSRPSAAQHSQEMPYRCERGGGAGAGEIRAVGFLVRPNPLTHSRAAANLRAALEMPTPPGRGSARVVKRLRAGRGANAGVNFIAFAELDFRGFPAQLSERERARSLTLRGLQGVRGLCKSQSVRLGWRAESFGQCEVGVGFSLRLGGEVH